MDLFITFLKLGFSHITDIQGYDHILFVMALSAVFSFTDWKKIIFLVTFFTIGHSVSLLLSVMNIVNFRSDVIEFLIPITIIFTCFFNMLDLTKSGVKKNSAATLGLVSFFGIIHGLGFSNYLKGLLGKSQSIYLELFSFNLGLEIGQILIVLICVFISLILENKLEIKYRDRVIGMSCIVIGLTINILIDKWIF